MNSNFLKHFKINSFDFFLLLIAFLYGNIFAIESSRFTVSSIFLFAIIAFLEILEKFLYFFFNVNQQKKINRQYFSTTNWRPKNLNSKTKDLVFTKYNNYLFFSFNLIKRGFLLGIFLEAFKVGS